MKPADLSLKIMYQAVPFLAVFWPKVKNSKTKCKKNMNF